MNITANRAKYLVLLFSVLFIACGENKQSPQEEQASKPFGCNTSPCKPLPLGVYESAGINDPVGNAVDSPALKGVLVRISWKVCGDDLNCLYDTVQEQLDKALTSNLSVGLMIMDGDEAPDAVKAKCTTFDFMKRDIPASMCLAWDTAYIEEKTWLLDELGARFDSHPALAYLYFTGACATNGAEGHCRIDESAYTLAGYTPSRLINAYKAIMSAYRTAFPTTPIIFEAHTIFDSVEPWQSLWDQESSSGRVGVASWWCSERLSVNGNETQPVWNIVQEAAQTSFAICQTVGNFTNQPYRFSDPSLDLDYGVETEWNIDDSINAFEQTLNWAQGFNVHVGQPSVINRFSVIETWTVDLKNPDFQDKLLLF